MESKAEIVRLIYLDGREALVAPQEAVERCSRPETATQLIDARTQDKQLQARLIRLMDEYCKRAGHTSRSFYVMEHLLMVRSVMI